MRDYRAYVFGIDGHRFLRVEDFASNQVDDAAALNAAKQLVDGHDMELWDQGRLVARLSSDGEIASPELAPFMISAAASKSEGDAGKPSGQSISELDRARPTENHLILGW